LNEVTRHTDLPHPNLNPAFGVELFKGQANRKMPVFTGVFTV